MSSSNLLLNLSSILGSIPACTFMASEVTGAAQEFAKTFIVDTIKDWYSYITNYDDNIKTLVEKHTKLDNQKETLTNIVDRGKDLQKPTKVTVGWLDDVRKLQEEEELKQLINDESRIHKDQCCLGRMHCNLQQRYKMSKAAELCAKRIEDIIKESPTESLITEPITRSELKSIPTEFLKSLQSRADLMERVIKKLRDDHVYVVGIFGMGAIGKTTLVKEIANKGMKDKFEQIVMVEISEAPNIERIQDQIADQLSITSSLDRVHSTQERATYLYTILKNRKLLVILDNVWGKLDLSKVGIPHPHEFCCKLLLTTREKNVCEIMGASEASIFEVHTLDEKESRQLFRARVGEKGQDEKIEERLLKKCAGLPLSIVALADVLKDQEVPMWEHYAFELEKPISSHGTTRGVNRLAYSILETSYKLMESEEKKSFFMLACLFPFGTSIPVNDMMRYGIGLGLFQHVNNLTEAMEQAKTWADELKSSSLLLADNQDGHVKVHDVVRASMLSLANKDGHAFMVEAFPRWMDEETYRKFRAISLMTGTDHSRLSGLNSDELQILMFNGTKPRVIDDTFSLSRLTNLNVLVLKRMTCVSCLSIANVKSCLRTLHLEGCELKDIGWIGELFRLVVLSLRQSTLNELPEAMKKLCSLRLLDISGCKIGAEGIPANVLASLYQLEGLYAFDAAKKWDHSVQERGVEDGNTSIEQTEDSINQNRYANVGELSELSYLNVLEMKVQLEELPTYDDRFVENLDQFHVHVYGSERDIWRSSVGMRQFSRAVELSSLNFRSVMEKRCARALVQKTESLYLLKGVEGFEHFLVHEQQEGGIGDLFRGIKQLLIEKCKDDFGEGITWTLFPNLEILIVENLQSMRRMIPPMRDGIIQAGGMRTMLFSKLQVLRLDQLPELHPCVLPIDLLPPNLTNISVEFCERLKYLFGNNEAENETGGNSDESHSPVSIKLPSLIDICLLGLPELESVMEGLSSRNSNNSPALFNNEQLIFEALETLYMEQCNGFTTVWDMNISHWYRKEKLYVSTAGFHNLKKLEIRDCDQNLKTVGSLSIAAALVNLKELCIYYCQEMREVILMKEEEESDEVLLSMLCNNRGNNNHGGDTLSLFPSLQELYLDDCPGMERFITLSTQKCCVAVVEFPSLQSLYIQTCDAMQSLSGSGSGSRSVTFRAPKLSRFEYDYDEQPVTDINQFLLARATLKDSSSYRLFGYND